MKTVKILILLLSINVYCKGQTRDSAKIEYRVTKIADKKFSIDFIITLLDDQRIISPFSKDSVWIKTSIDFNDSSSIKLKGHLIESPVSKEEFDPIMEKMVRFNRKHVKFTQNLEILSSSNFTVNGQIEYMTITDKYALPPETVNFVLTYDKRTGNITVK